MRILAIDLSTKTGYAVLEDGKLIDYGQIIVKVVNFNVNNDPNKQPEYPYNLIDAAKEMAQKIIDKYLEVLPEHVVIENTVKGRNRHTQRLLENLHYALLERLRQVAQPMTYMDPSEWRSALEMRLTKDDKTNNKLVNQGKKRGKITKKHLSVRMANEMFGLKLKMKDNDIADALCLAKAYYEVYHNVQKDT